MKGYKHGGDIYSNDVKLDFSVNINPQGMPENIINAAAEAVKNCSAYPDPVCRKLTAAVAKKEGVPQEWVICGNGAADIIYRLVLALSPKRAVLLAPGFSDYASALRVIDCGIRYHYLKESNDFKLTDELLNSLTDEMDLLILCNPNNPTGQVINNEILLKIIKKCKEHNIFLMVDECFLDFVENSSTQSIVSLLPDNYNLLLLSAFTKFYACAGLRIGYAICPNTALLEKISQFGQSWPVSIPAQAAGLAALSEIEYAQKTMKIVLEERCFLYDALTGLGIKVYNSSANFMLFYHKEKLYDKLLEKGILIRSCHNYPGLGRGYYRIAVKLHDENVMLINAIKQILKGDEVCPDA